LIEHVLKTMLFYLIEHVLKHYVVLFDWACLKTLCCFIWLSMF